MLIVRANELLVVPSRINSFFGIERVWWSALPPSQKAFCFPFWAWPLPSMKGGCLFLWSAMHRWSTYLPRVLLQLGWRGFLRPWFAWEFVPARLARCDVIFLMCSWYPMILPSETLRKSVLILGYLSPGNGEALRDFTSLAMTRFFRKINGFLLDYTAISLPQSLIIFLVW